MLPPRTTFVLGGALLGTLATAPRTARAQPASQRAVEMSSATMRNDSGAVARLLDAGTPPDTPRDENDTALMSAARWGRVGIARLLLTRGADALLENARGETARDLATRSGHHDVARLLEAAERGRPLPEIRVPRNGRTNYEMAVELSSAAGLLGNLAKVRALLDDGADPNFPTGEGNTAIMSAAYWGRIDVVRELLARGADPKHADARGRTALTRAQAESHRDVVAEVQRALGIATEQPRRRQPPTDAPSPAPAAAPNGQLPPAEFKATGVAPRGGVWEGRFANGNGLVRFTVAPDGRSITEVEYEGDIRCSDAGVGMGRSYGRTQRVDYVTRGARLVIDRGAVDGTYHDERAGVHWHLQGHFVGATTARGKVRIGAQANTCDSWGMQWTASRVR
ncbi:MAG: ankyrin repeat domain-containing protein [Gemmatirosa sp.]